MIKKRLVGVVTVKDGWAVQSFGYGRWLPLGKPEVLTENLDRWGADEIVLQCIDRGARGPDLQLLGRVSSKGLSTPLIYAGGIRNAADAVAAVKSGADRVCVDSLLHDDPEALRALSAPLGAQAVIASMWSIPDEATALLMAEFYINVLRGKLPYPSALAQAQRRIADSSAAQLGVAQRLQTLYEAGGRQDARLARRALAHLRRPDERPFAHPLFWGAHVCQLR